jgi:hypothetical protein
MANARPLDRIGAIYGKPFLKDMAVSPEKALTRLKNELLYRIKKKLQQSQISERAKKAFAKNISVRMGPSSILVESSHPALIKIIEGQKKGQMRWLMKAKAPIPIITDAGELIFRNATPRSMANGKWVHPGRQPQTFVDLARKEAKELVKQRLLEELKRVVVQTAKKRK